MLLRKSIGVLILILFISMLGANITGEALRSILHFTAGESSIVERALLQYIEYNIGPHMFNLIIFSLSFELLLKFNLVTLLGIFFGWYYYKYSY